MSLATNVIFVSATRASSEVFWAYSPLGLSIQRLNGITFLNAADPVEAPVQYTSLVCFDNHRGLPDVFNQAIEDLARDAPGTGPEEASPEHPSEAIVVFIHDDVWIDDAQIGEHLIAGLDRFDLLGVAGSTGRVAGQVAWAFLDQDFTPNSHAASGAVCHGNDPCGQITLYGPSRQSCELLDGVLIAARLQTLLDSGLRFDPRFQFHFYDMDLCRSARSLGLRLGTWPMAITHQGAGEFGGPPWFEGLADYLAKWGD